MDLSQNNAILAKDKQLNSSSLSWEASHSGFCRLGCQQSPQAIEFKLSDAMAEFGDAMALSHWARMLPHVQFSSPQWKEQTGLWDGKSWRNGRKVLGRSKPLSLNQPHRHRRRHREGICWYHPAPFLEDAFASASPNLSGSELWCGKKRLGPWQRLGPKVSAEEMKTRILLQIFIWIRQEECLNRDLFQVRLMPQNSLVQYLSSFCRRE